MKESRDILSLFEALNSHEVFTPPRVARQMLDLLPTEIWSDPSIKILDPCTKSGVFLRESFYRLFTSLDGKGLYETENGDIYDLDDKQQRINHILKNMLFGIATSELTSYVARRTLYGVMRANSDKQLSAIEAFEQSSNYHQWTEQEKYNFIGRNKFNEYFDHNLFCTPEYEGFEQEGNIFYPNDEVKTLVMAEDNYEIEDKYFPFIEENTKHKKILDIRGGFMRFDVVVGNPPYQVSDGGAGASAIPIYHEFINSSLALKPRYLSMIIPARWYVGGRGLSAFREKMLSDKRFREIHDYPNASECFPGVMIKGGIMFFLWDAKYNGNCEITTHRDGDVISKAKRPLLENGVSTFIRDNEAVSILRKVSAKSPKSFSELISTNDPFGFDVREKNSMKRIKPSFQKNSSDGLISFYYNGWRNQGIGYIDPKSVRRNSHLIDSFKMLLPKAVGIGDRSKDVIKPFIPERHSCCTETYLVIGPFDYEDELLNAKDYINTKFFHFMVSLKKITQETRRGVYELVPMQDFSKKWNDQDLYKKYELSEMEIAFIENNVRSMDG